MALGNLGGSWSWLTASKVTDLVNPGQAMTLVATLVQSLSQLLSDTVLIVLLTPVHPLRPPQSARTASQRRSQRRTHPRLHDKGCRWPEAIPRPQGRRQPPDRPHRVAPRLGDGGRLSASLGGCSPSFSIFIPNIGSVLAAIPPVALGLVQFGPVEAALLALGYVVINLAVRKTSLSRA